VILRVYQPDRTTKAVAIEAHTTAFEVLELLLEKNILPCSTKYALVEKIPSLKLERCFEDSELVLDCVINWNVCSENLIFFEEREDMYGIFENPKIWLGGQLPVPEPGHDSDSVKDLFVLNNELNLPGHSEHLYVRTNGNNWKRRFCMLRNSGLYVSKHYSKNISAFQRIVSFKPYLRLYTTTGGWKKLLAPTPFGFTVRPYTTYNTGANYAVYFCATSEASLRIWYSLLRIALVGLQLIQNYDQRRKRSEKRVISSSISFSAGLTNHDQASVGYRTGNKIHQIKSRLASLDRCNSVGDKVSQGRLRNSMEWSIIGSSSELGCVTGRSDVRSCSNSVGELAQSEDRQSSSACGSSLSSLFACSISGSKDDNDDGVTPKKLKKKRGVTSKKRSIFGNGPAARRCNRSIGQISAPFDVQIPTWVREGRSPDPQREIDETAM
ncbi:hypothetical protein PHET_04578, partial [Paragonimus heterotremus]